MDEQPPPRQFCDECEHFSFDHFEGTGHCLRCDDCCEFELPRKVSA